MNNKDCDCKDKAQCWEPCGYLGHDERYVDVVQGFELNYRRELLGEFSLTTTDVELYELGKKYHTICEEYDQKVCSFTEDGVAMPIDGYELGLININTSRVRKQIQREGMLKGYSPKQIREAIQKVGKEMS